MTEYDALVELLRLAEELCFADRQPSKACAMANLQAVLKEDVELSKMLQRRMAAKLVVAVSA